MKLSLSISNKDNVIGSEDNIRYIIAPIENRRLSLVSGKFPYGLNVPDVVPKQHQHVEQMRLKSPRKDLKTLSDAEEFEVYEDFPVEGFGVAYLASYGWKPGQGIGHRAKKDTPISQPKHTIAKQEIGSSLDKGTERKRETEISS